MLLVEGGVGRELGELEISPPVYEEVEDPRFRDYHFLKSRVSSNFLKGKGFLIPHSTGPPLNQMETS